jgi:hypothetical protein
MRKKRELIEGVAYHGQTRHHPRPRFTAGCGAGISGEVILVNNFHLKLFILLFVTL